MSSGSREREDTGTDAEVGERVEEDYERRDYCRRTRIKGYGQISNARTYGDEYSRKRWIARKV